MNSTKQHAFPGYEMIAADLKEAARFEEVTKQKACSAATCQSLLETIESYAQEAQSLPRVEAKLMEARMMLGEMMDYLGLLPYRNRAEREARQKLIERAERILNHDANESAADGRAEAAE